MNYSKPGNSRKKVRHMRSAVLLVSIIVLLSACSSGPPPKLYLLQAPAETNEATENAAQNSIRALGISLVSLPGYASDARIASREGSDLIVQLAEQRWAEEPEDAITRLLAEQLRARAGATVLIEPWPRNYNPQARVEVMIDTLLREPDGGAHISGQINLITGDGRDLLTALSFDTRVRGRSSDVTEFFRAVSVIVDELARLSVDALQNQNPQS